MLLFYAICLNAYAEQKYNPYTGKWETTSKDAAIERNPYTGEQHYQPKGSELEYNPFSKKYEWTPPSQAKPQPQSGGFQVPYIAQPVYNKPSNQKTVSNDYASRDYVDLESDAIVDHEYSFYKTTVAFKSDDSEFTTIALRCLEPLLIKKGWTIVDGSTTHYDLVTMPLFKEHNNFNGTGYSYLTMNLYFFKNPDTGNDKPVIDAFVAKQIKSNDIKREIQEMCVAIAKKLPNIKKLEKTNEPDDNSLVAKNLFDEENVSDEIKKLEQKAEKEGITVTEMDRLEKLVEANKKNKPMQKFELSIGGKIYEVEARDESELPEIAGNIAKREGITAISETQKQENNLITPNLFKEKKK